MSYLRSINRLSMAVTAAVTLAMFSGCGEATVTEAAKNDAPPAEKTVTTTDEVTTSVAVSTAKAGLYLQPMGSADAEVTISPAIYVTNKQQLAHVECEITEIEDGKPVSDKLTWMVRKSKSGWRIFGMLLTLEGGNQDFLSLESAQDVDTILQMSGNEASTRRADAKTSISLK